MKTDYILSNYQNPIAHLSPNYGTENEIKGNLDLNALSKIKFAFGISHAGTHTWLLSLGKVYEVHYDNVGRSGVYGQNGLYETRTLRLFTQEGHVRKTWPHGSIVVPKGHAPSISGLSKMSCAS